MIRRLGENAFFTHAFDLPSLARSVKSVMCCVVLCYLLQFVSSTLICSENWGGHWGLAAKKWRVTCPLPPIQSPLITHFAHLHFSCSVVFQRKVIHRNKDHLYISIVQACWSEWTSRSKLELFQEMCMFHVGPTRICLFTQFSWINRWSNIPNSL